MAVRTPESTEPRAPRPDRGKRTCIGCNREDEPEAMVRLVVSPDGDVGVDLAGGHFGRGAHVHPSPRCLASAPARLSKSFRRTIRVTADELRSAIVEAADRRALGLLASAARSQRLEIGADSSGQAFASGKAHVLVVARDAAAAASVGSVMHAVANGGAVAWGTKEKLGALVGRPEVAVLGVTSEALAVALQAVVRMASSVAQSGGRANEEHPRGAMATED